MEATGRMNGALLQSLHDRGLPEGTSGVRIVPHAPRAFPGAPAGMPCAARRRRLGSDPKGPSRSRAESGGAEGAESATPGPSLRSGQSLGPGRAGRCASEWCRGLV